MNSLTCRSLETIRGESVEQLRNKLRENEAIDALFREKRAIVLGAASEGARCLSLLESMNFDVIAVVDEGVHVNKIVEGHRVIGLSDLFEKMAPSLPVILCTHRTGGIHRRLSEVGFQLVIPFISLQAAEPGLFPPHEFHDGLLESLVTDFKQLEWLRDEFSDQLSVKTLDSIIQYRISGNSLVFEDIFQPNLYYVDDLFQFSTGEELFIDAGAFEGDTISLFSSYVDGQYKKIVAFEPDPATFGRLKNNFFENNNVICINKGLSHSRSAMRFVSGEQRASVFSNSGNISVDVTDLDSSLTELGLSPTVIKMNIEGFELDALDGARNTIKENNPKLFISAYHRPSHLWEVARKIKTINPAYNIALRQFDRGLVESVIVAWT